MAARWLKDYSEKTKPSKRNIHGFMLFLRKKIIPSTAREELWKRYEGCHQAQFGQDSPVNTFAQYLQNYQLRCRDNKGKAPISDHALKMKFGNGLTSLIKQQVKLAINWYICSGPLPGCIPTVPLTCNLNKSLIWCITYLN